MRTLQKYCERRHNPSICVPTSLSWLFSPAAWQQRRRANASSRHTRGAHGASAVVSRKRLIVIVKNVFTHGRFSRGEDDPRRPFHIAGRCVGPEQRRPPRHRCAPRSIGCSPGCRPLVASSTAMVPGTAEPRPKTTCSASWSTSKARARCSPPSNSSSLPPQRAACQASHTKSGVVVSHRSRARNGLPGSLASFEPQAEMAGHEFACHAAVRYRSHVSTLFIPFSPTPLPRGARG